MLEGWGAVAEGFKVFSHLTGTWASWHKRVLELEAVLLAIHHFLPCLQGHPGLAMKDGTVAATYSISMGCAILVASLPAICFASFRPSPTLSKRLLVEDMKGILVVASHDLNDPPFLDGIPWEFQPE